MVEYRARSGHDWQLLEKDMRVAGAREGNKAQIAAPVGTAGAVFNGRQGVITKFNYGWITVALPNAGDVRFRPDELVIL